MVVEAVYERVDDETWRISGSETEINRGATVEGDEGREIDSERVKASLASIK